SLDRFDEAIAVLQEQAKLTPNDPEPQKALGIMYLRAKRNKEARDALEKAAQLAPNSLAVLKQLVELDLLDKDFNAARQRIQRQFQKNPDTPAAHFLEGRIMGAEGKWDSAETEAKKAIQLDPNFSSGYSLLIQAYRATNKFPQAISQLQAL